MQGFESETQCIPCGEDIRKELRVGEQGHTRAREEDKGGFVAECVHLGCSSSEGEY